MILKLQVRLEKFFKVVKVKVKVAGSDINPSNYKTLANH